MAEIKIAFINESTIITDREAKAVMDALQIQVHRDFYPAWGIDADLSFYTTKESAPDDYWWLVMLDYPDADEAYGYHDLTSKGLPLGKIFISVHKLGESWSNTASHELLEMLADPGINLMVNRRDGSWGNVLYAYEVCDACQDAAYSYKINGIEVSDFVYPSWFEQIDHPRGTKFDFKDKIRKPFELLPGGYTAIWKLNSGEGWTQIDGPTTKRTYRMRARVGSRRERRRTDRENWMTSDKKVIAARKKGVTRKAVAKKKSTKKK